MSATSLGLALANRLSACRQGICILFFRRRETILYATIEVGLRLELWPAPLCSSQTNNWSVGCIFYLCNGYKHRNNFQSLFTHSDLYTLGMLVTNGFAHLVSPQRRVGTTRFCRQFLNGLNEAQCCRPGVNIRAAQRCRLGLRVKSLKTLHKAPGMRLLEQSHSRSPPDAHWGDGGTDTAARARSQKCP